MNKLTQDNPKRVDPAALSKPQLVALVEAAELRWCVMLRNRNEIASIVVSSRTADDRARAVAEFVLVEVEADADYRARVENILNAN